MKTGKKLTREDKINLSNKGGEQHEDIRMEGPMSEKDEVKAAEERTKKAQKKAKTIADNKM